MLFRYIKTLNKKYELFKIFKNYKLSKLIKTSKLFKFFKSIIFILSLLYLLFFNNINVMKSYAHPHVFINATIKAVFDENGLKGLQINWIYDPNYSYQIISDCDMDMDDNFTEEEIKDVYKYYFEQLEQYNYFIEIKIGKKNIKIDKVEDFSASIDTEDEVVEYNFFIPLDVKYTNDGQTLEVKFADPTYYTAFTCPQSQIYIKGYKAKIVNVKIDYAGKIYFTFYKG